METMSCTSLDWQQFLTLHPWSGWLPFIILGTLLVLAVVYKVEHYDPEHEGTQSRLHQNRGTALMILVPIVFGSVASWLFWGKILCWASTSLAALGL